MLDCENGQEGSLERARDETILRDEAVEGLRE
jgi:hypothetical protein